MKRAGIRFAPKEYYEIGVENESISLMADVNGEIKEYDVSGGGIVGKGSFTCDLRTFPHTMTAGETYQIVFTVVDGAKMRFESNASASKIKINEDGLMECIGSSTGACMITITALNTNDEEIGQIKLRPSVV